MPKLIDRETGEAVVVPSGEVQKLLKSKRYELAGDAVLEDSGGGQAISVAPEQVNEVLRSGNVDFQSGASAYDAARDAELEEQYGDGVFNTALAGATGFARGATLGLSDLIASGVLDDDGEFALEQLRLRNQVASTAGEIGGALAPALLSGGTGLVGSAARLSPAGAITRLGAGTAGRVAGEGVAANMLRGGIAGVIEGTGFGVGSQITNTVLHDDPFTIDALASNVGLSAVLGGAGGALLGGLGVAGRRIAQVETPLDDVSLSLARAEQGVASLSKAGRIDDLAWAGAPVDDLRQLARKNSTAAQGLRHELGKEMDLGVLFSKSKDNVYKTVQHLDDYVKTAKELDTALGASTGVVDELSEVTFAKSFAPAELKALQEVSDEAVESVLGGKFNQEFLANLDPATKLVVKSYAARVFASTEQGAAHMSGIKQFARAGVGAYAKGLVGSSTRGASALSQGGKSLMRMGAAWTAGKITNAMFAAQAVSGQVKLGVGAALKALAKPSVRRSVIAGTNSVLSQYRFGNVKDKEVGRARIKEVQQALVNPGQTLRRFQIAMLPISLQNPAVGEKVSQALLSRLNYLAERMPRLLDPASFRINRGEGKPSGAQLAKWARVIQAAENPMSILDDLKNQSLHIDAVETVKVLYPALFAKMQEELVLQMAETGFKAPYKSRLQLSVMFDVPLDYSQTPGFVASIQEMYAAKAQSAPQPRGTPGGSKPPGTEQTAAQRLTTR